MKTKFHAASEPIRKLRLIQHYFDGVANTKAILAGGALRDDYMGKEHYEIADYDYFITDISKICETNKVSTDSAIDILIDQTFPNADDSVQLFDTVYTAPGGRQKGSHAQIQSVWEIQEEMYTYQLIFTKHDPIIHVNKYFDIGFCKTYFDGKKIRYTNDFLHDVNNKTFTIVGDDLTQEQVEYAIFYHAGKLSVKYPEFTVIVPERYQQFVKGQGF